MANKKQQERKKKERAQKSHEKVVKLREETRAKAKKAKEIHKKDKELRPKQVPIRERQRRDAEIMAQLQHNMKILQALEEEYDKEMAVKQEVDKGFQQQEQDALKEVQEQFEREQEANKDMSPPEESKGSKLIL